jgi:hypothetical protein
VKLVQLLFALFGFAGLVVALPPVAPAQTERQRAQSAPHPADLNRNGALILIRSVMIALDQANKTGNYTVLRDLGAPGFQTNTPAQLAEIFATQRRDNLDLSGVVVIEPQLTNLPQVEASGMMRMVGFFPSVPQQVNFEMLFSPVNGQWRLFGLSVNVGQSGPTAPQLPAAAPASAPQAAAPPLLGQQLRRSRTQDVRSLPSRQQSPLRTLSSICAPRPRSRRSVSGSTRKAVVSSSSHKSRVGIRPMREPPRSRNEEARRTLSSPGGFSA